MTSAKFLRMASRLSETGHECRLSENFEPYQLTADISLTHVDVGLKSLHPVLGLTNTIQCLDRRNKLDEWFFMGNGPSQYQSFWETWRLQKPRHPVYEVHQDRLDRCIPICIHADEGTSQKKRGMMVLQTQVLLGKGTRKRKSTALIPGLNFKGKSLCTRLVYSVMMAHCYSGKKCKTKNYPLLKLVEHLSLELRQLFDNGVVVTFGGLSQKIWLVPIAFKGDWPALVKIGQLNRHHLRDTTATEFGHGICHLCQGGREGHKWNDVSLGNMTRMRMDMPQPWQCEPALIRNLPMGDASYKPMFFKVDIFHTCHKGVMADAAANAIVS